MKKVGDMKLYSFEELLEEDYGKVGTPERDAFERSVDEAVQAYHVGEAIKQAREAQNLTQPNWGEDGCAKGSGMSFRERIKHHACFHDACIPCVRCTSCVGNERNRKGCAIIKNLYFGESILCAPTFAKK